MITSVFNGLCPNTPSIEGCISLEGDEFNVREEDLKGASLKIGGQIYRLRGIHKGKFRVFFDGEKYIARQDKKIVVLEDSRIDMRTSPFEQSSLFPNIGVTDATSIMLIPVVELKKGNSIDNNQPTSETKDNLENKKLSEDGKKSANSSESEENNDPEEAERVIVEDPSKLYDDMISDLKKNDKKIVEVPTEEIE